jgi:heterodisulfide reductase subunit C
LTDESTQEFPLVTDEDCDPTFVERVKATPGGEHILDCYACGTCSASCPIRAIDETFNPRRIIRLALLGLKDEVLRSEFIWLCTGCYICQERCPQDVRITELMMAFRNVATAEGYPHPTIAAIAEALAKQGNILEIGEFENEKRQKVGLPPRHVPPDSVRALLKETGLLDTLATAKARSAAAAPAAAPAGGEGAKGGDA